MKKLLAILFVLLMAVTALTACNATPTVKDVTMDKNGDLILEFSDGSIQKYDDFKTITDASINAEGHLIITYSDGTTEDKGYVSPKKCIITFKDYDGTILAVEETYAGLTVKAPADPVREDYTFAGWDKDLASLTESAIVTATYTPKPTYTVTFVHEDGTVLKTETVVEGKSATPPADPTLADHNFVGWSGNYTNVTANVTVKATFTPKGSYTVTFVDYNGLHLGTVTVKEGETAVAPVTPSRDGYTFKGWSSSLTNITDRKTVTAQYTLISANNVFDLSYKVSGDNVTVTLSLAGNVSLAGFEGTLSFEGMTATSVTGNSANVLANLKGDGTVSIAYTSATNVTKAETVLTVTLTKTAAVGSADLTLAECFDQSFTDVSYKIIGESMKLQ